MKTSLWNRVASLLWTGVLLLAWPAHCSPQQPASPPATPQAPAPPDPATEIDQLLNKANDAIFVKGKLKDGEEASAQALGLSQKLGDKSRILRSRMALGTAYAYQYRWTEALELFQSATLQARELGDKKALARCLNSSATALRGLGRYEDALNYYHQTLVSARELNDLRTQWTVLRNTGALYFETGESDRSEAPLQESLRLARELKNNALQALSLETLGLWEMNREHYSAALNFYEQSLATKPENPLVLAETLNNLGITYELLGESQKAVDVLQQALKTKEATGSGTDSVILSNLGESQLSLGLLPQALASEQRALAIAHQAGGMPYIEWMAEKRAGQVQRAMGNTEEALAHYRTSIDDLERLRPGLLATESGRAAMLRSHGVFVEAADLLVELHREAEALAVAERGRARAFLDLLAESRVGVLEELTPEQKQREDSILGRISAAQKELWKEGLSPEEEKKHRAELAGAEGDLETFHTEVRESNPRFAAIQYPQPVGVTQIQQDLLVGQAALVEFLLGEKRSIVWVVTPNKVTAAFLPPRKEIEAQVASYRKVLSERASALTLEQSLTEINRDAVGLYTSLLQPVTGAIASSLKLIVVPDGALNYLPFETLAARPWRGSARGRPPSYLLENFSIVYGPSASALLTVQAMNRAPVSPRKALLAFGDPVVNSSGSTAAATSEGSRSARETTEVQVKDMYAERGFSFARLPYTREEVLAISALYPPYERQIYLGEQAREETVKSEKLDEYRYIHFASHGFIDETKPGRSGLLLSRDAQSAEDGILQMGEIMRLKMNADLVTLSACSTGLGKLVSGEGILGLTRAFFYSGARNVAVSLWNVNDSATAALMKLFYQNLNRGVPRGEALRQAQLALLRGKNSTWSHPYFWASFVLVGAGN